MNKIRAVFYDLDNTIYRQMDDVSQRIDCCIRAFSLSLTEGIKAYWLAEWSENGPMKHNLIDKVIEKFSLGVEKEKMISAYRNCMTVLFLDAGVGELLSAIRKKGIKQFIITNGHPGTQMTKISSLGLEETCDEIIVSVGEYAKPSSYWFLRLQEKYGLAPEECLSVGDWYAVDGIASQGAGVKFYYVKGGPVKEDLPFGVISICRITELGEYL